jgi:hypothetical protein
MDRETVIMTVSGLGEEPYRPLTAAGPLRHGGFAPQRRDVAGLTRLMGGAFFPGPRATDLVAYVRAPSPHVFPALTERPRLVRQAAPLWPLPAALPRRLVRRSRQAAAPVPVLDTLPLPLCSYTRGRRRDHCLAGHADSSSLRKIRGRMSYQ